MLVVKLSGSMMIVVECSLILFIVLTCASSSSNLGSIGGSWCVACGVLGADLVWFEVGCTISCVGSWRLSSWLVMFFDLLGRDGVDGVCVAALWSGVGGSAIVVGMGVSRRGSCGLVALVSLGGGTVVGCGGASVMWCRSCWALVSL